MAFNIRSSSSGSTSDNTQKASSTKSSGTDLFAQNLAQAEQAARTALKSAATKAAAAPPRHTATAPKPAPAAKPASTARPKSVAESDDSRSKAGSSATGTKSSAASGTPKSSASAKATANAQAGQDGSAPDDAASTATSAGATGAKGRSSPRAVAKSPQPGATANTTGDAIDDPTVDTSNQSGLSLLQLLAQSLEGDNAAAPSSDAVTGTDQTNAKATDKSSDDPNAIALAMFTQALAAALGASPAMQQSATSNVASAATGDATAGITDATQSPNGSASMQDLMSVLTHDVAAGANGKSDDVASQFNVDATKGSAGDSSSAATAAMGPNSLAHLGVASHFSAQHLRNDTNTGELKSPVGSSGWDDELGTQLTWMTQKGLESGSLRVSPEHLGPVEVNISVQNSDASVWFGATHPDTRAALEQALPRLREMFASQGMNLADSGVSRQPLSQRGSRNQGRSSSSQGVSGVSAIGATDGGTSAALRMNLGLVDTYV